MDTAWAAPRPVQQAARATQEVVQISVSTTAEVAQRTTDQVTEVLGEARRRTQDLAERASQSLQTVTTRSSTLLARGVQEMSSECLDMVQERVRKNHDGVNALVRCRSLPEFLRARGTLFRDNMELTLTNSRRLAEISARFADNATRTTAAQVQQNASRL